jgi:putative hydrolase of the HAD superfamily
MNRKLKTIGFDADDTLWHNERFFQDTQARFAEMLADHAPPDDLDARLLAAERRNIGHYGYGVKGFTLSMIETAIEVTDGAVPSAVIAALLAMGRDMLDHPIELLPHARAAVEHAAEGHRIVLITKGDLLHQERKLAQSGLGDLFDAVEIVSEKEPGTYARIFAGFEGGAEAAMMIGNSLKSDVAPAIAAGGWGVHVPHEVTWDLEHAPEPDSPRFRRLGNLGGLARLIDEIG